MRRIPLGPIRVVAILVIGFVLLQLVPYGRDHTNPPVVAEPMWDSARTRSLAERACFDCHSNQTRWPWYSSVAPASWLVLHDVAEGRQHLNLSDWRSEAGETQRMSRLVSRGDMPPWYYARMHPAARLSREEQQQLIDGLGATK